MPRIVTGLICALFVSLFPAQSAAQVDARMLRFPAVSQTHIAFVYAGDIWTVSKAGGTAYRLSSPLGEESFPRLSPDGSKIAFSAEYDGNTDVYVMPTTGGEPLRLTHHPMADRVVGWTPDGTRVLFASSRESGRQRYNQFFTVGLDGGLPQKLPVPYGEFGTYSPDGAQFVYMPMAQDFRTWKRYRGGWAPDLWLFDLKTFASRKLTDNPGNDAQPMWHGNTLYFLSDRGDTQRNNIWAHDLKTNQVRKVTDFGDFDITFPSIGPDAIVFQAGGRLYLLDLPSEKVREVEVRVVTDEATLRPRTVKGEGHITSAAVSPTGRRAVFNVRGDIVTVPAEHGAILNITRSSGVAERYPRWSPDGRLIAYWSDRSGEYELTVRPADGTGEERKLTSMGKGFRYAPQWSPDSRKLAFVDQSMKLYLFEMDGSRLTEIDQSHWWMGHGALESFRFSWSPDSRWVTYARGDRQTGNSAIFVYDTRERALTQATTGYLNDRLPVFDPEGKYLYYASDRAFDPVYGSFDNSWTYANPTKLVAAPLRKDVHSPLPARNDAESPAIDTGDKKAAEKADDKPDEKKDATAKPAPPPAVTIDFDGFEHRVIVLPPASGNFSELQAVKGKVLYRRTPRAGSGRGERSPIVFFDFQERAEKTVLDNADGFMLTHDGSKAFVRQGNRYTMVEIKPDQKFDKPMPVGDIEVPVSPRAEWRQMFMDTYRLQRDFFYDPTLHGVDWDGLRDRYGKLLDDAVTRWDVDFVIGEFIAELNASHTYRSGGDVEQSPSRSVGMLGVDWELTPAKGSAPAAYRIARIVRGGPWDADVRSPLHEPGVDVGEGDYVLAVNGVPLDPARDPWASFQGLGEKTVVLTVSNQPAGGKTRQVVVRTLSDETELRFLAWVEERRQIVDKATGGRVGYIYVQSTGVPAQNELMRQFMGQWRKEGLIIDERWNGGGQIPDRFIELLNRPILAYWGVRAGESWQWPPVAHRGAQVMLINGWSGSGGDAFPTYFRQAGLGPLIGTRTWGGLIGISGVPGLVDGGSVTVPTFRMYDPEGTWFPEGHGVEPDIQVEDDPTQLAKGTDPQLERAIKETLDLMAKLPPVPARPPYERR
jgi:tricorn protease